jgi:hypothetical protein
LGTCFYFPQLTISEPLVSRRYPVTLKLRRVLLPALRKPLAFGQYRSSQRVKVNIHSFIYVKFYYLPVGKAAKGWI